MRRNEKRKLTDYVDTAELLHEHHDTGGESGTTVTGNGKEFDDSETTGSDVCLFLEEGVDHEKITSSLELGVTETAEGLVGIDVTTSTAVYSERE
jgi:hypothetical protein